MSGHLIGARRRGGGGYSLLWLRTGLERPPEAQQWRDACGLAFQRVKDCSQATGDALPMFVENWRKQLLVHRFGPDQFVEVGLKGCSMHSLWLHARQWCERAGLSPEADTQPVRLHPCAQVRRPVLALVADPRAVPAAELLVNEVETICSVTAAGSVAVEPGASTSSAGAAPADLDPPVSLVCFTSQVAEVRQVLDVVVAGYEGHFDRGAAGENPGHPMRGERTRLLVESASLEHRQIAHAVAPSSCRSQSHTSSRESIPIRQAINIETSGQHRIRRQMRESGCVKKSEKPRVCRGFPVVELAGLEPATSWVRSRRSPN